MLENVLGMFLQAVAVGPLAELLGGSAAEFQKLLPILFKEIQDPGNNFFLFRLRGTEGRAVDVDVKAAGPGLMGQVAHFLCLVQNIAPGHFIKMIIQGHGVRHDLESFVQGTVMLTVDSLLNAIGNIHDSGCIGVVLATIVNFQFHAKEAIPVTQKNWLRFIVIVVDCLMSSMTAMAGVATGIIIVLVQIIGIVLLDRSSTVYSTGIMPVIARLAQGRVTIPGIVIRPDSLTAFSA